MITGKFWDFTTTIRNPDRFQDFAKVGEIFEGKKWISGDQIQIDFQIYLIKEKLYLKEETVSEDTVSLKRAKEIAKGRWKYPHMRGRNSFSPLKKLGICYLDKNKKIHLTNLGKELANDKIEPKDFFYNTLLKFQLPQHDKDSSYSKKKGYAIKPLIGTLQLIEKVNKLWEKKKKKAVGISKQEFDLFVPTLIDYKDIDVWAENLIKFRESLRNAIGKSKKDEIIDDWKRILASWSKNEWTKSKNQEKVRTIKNRFDEYGDNIRRYFRITGWIHLRGNGYHIDLNPRRKVETDSLLSMKSSPETFKNHEEYAMYLSDQTKPHLPWKTKEKLVEQYAVLKQTILEITKSQKIKLIITPLEENKITACSMKELEKEIGTIRLELQRVDMIAQENNLSLSENVCNVISDLTDLNKEKKGALELEYQITRGLIALDDGEITPNYPLGDDGEPLNTAPGGVGDIECVYTKFTMLCEVTLLTDGKQWVREGQPVTKQYHEFAGRSPKLKTFCLFIAPKLHDNTIGQFWFENNRNGKKQTKIIPITITQFIEILEVLKNIKIKNPKKTFSHEKLLKMYQEIINSMTKFNDEMDWRKNIQTILDLWKKEILSAS